MVEISHQAALCTCKRNCGRFFPQTTINFQPSGAQCEIYLYRTFQAGNGGL